jgi:hypothetical protein
MSWNRRAVVICTLTTLFTFSGCRRASETATGPRTRHVFVDSEFRAIITTMPGAKLEWEAVEGTQPFEIVPDPGLCEPQSKLHGAKDDLATCIVAKQNFSKEHPIFIYSYTIRSAANPAKDGTGYVAVGPGHCPYC